MILLRAEGIPNRGIAIKRLGKRARQVVKLILRCLEGADNRAGFVENLSRGCGVFRF